MECITFYSKKKKKKSNLTKYLKENAYCITVP